MPINVRHIRANDAESYRALRLEALTEAPHIFRESVEEATATESAEWARLTAEAAEGQTACMFVADHDESELVGLVRGDIQDAADLMITQLWVSPRFRGRRLAIELLNAVRFWGARHGAERSIILVTEGEEPAMRLYEHCGFRLTGHSQPNSTRPHIRFLEMVSEDFSYIP